MRYNIIAILLLLVAVSGHAAAPVIFKGNEAALQGVCIRDLRTGKTTVAYNEAKVFIPASVMKCVTAASAFKLLNSNFSFKTLVSVSGNIENGVLQGNIVITGGGDPTLCSRFFPAAPCITGEIVRWVKSAGIDSIAGTVIVEQGRFPVNGISPYWLVEDLEWEYGAGYYGLNYKDNSFAVKERRGIERYAMPCPAAVLETDVVESLASQGIGCGDGCQDITDINPCVKPLVHTSPSRNSILRVMMEKSDNLYAEGMLRALAIDSCEVSEEKALSAQTTLLRGMGYDLSTMRIADGCGLAVTDRLSPRFICSLLADMAGDRNYVALFPKVGVEGTVRSLLANTRLKGKLALKSGSMTGVLCYAGYAIDSAGNPTHAVVIMVNNFTSRVAEIRNAIGRYLQTQF